MSTSKSTDSTPSPAVRTMSSMSSTSNGSHDATSTGAAIPTANGIIAQLKKPIVAKASSTSPIEITDNNNSDPAASTEQSKVQSQAESARTLKLLEAKAALADIPPQQMILARRGDVQTRNAYLSSTLTSLQSTLHQSSSDSNDVLKYLENEVRRKDILTKKVSHEIKELYQKQQAEKTEKQEEYTKEIRELEEVFILKEKELLEYNRIRHQEYNDLLLFKKIHTELQDELSSTKSIILKNEKRHMLQMSDLEKKFLLARQKLLQESQERIEESRRAYKEEVGRELDLESKFILNENQRIKNEVEFHRVLIMKLEATNKDLTKIVSEFESNLKNLNEKDLQYASFSLSNQKVMKELKWKKKMMQENLEEMRKGDREEEKERERMLMLQQQQQLLLTEGESTKGGRLLLKSGREEEKSSSALVTTTSQPSITPISSSSATSPAYQHLQSELSALLRSINTRTAENSLYQQHITYFLSQRTSVEIYFYDAYEQVKREIVQRRREEYEREYTAWKERLAELSRTVYQPRYHQQNGENSGRSHSQTQLLQTYHAPTPPTVSSSVTIHSDPRLPEPICAPLNISKLALNDFTLHDRERVLQLLCEKLNEETYSSSNNGSEYATGRQSSISRGSSALSLYAANSLGISRPQSGVHSNNSNTSLVVSRPSSSSLTRPKSRDASRPTSGTNSVINGNGTSSKPSSAKAQHRIKRQTDHHHHHPSTTPPPSHLSHADLRPHELSLLGVRGQDALKKAHELEMKQKGKKQQHMNAAAAAANGGTGTGRRKYEKDPALPSFFPPRGDTPVELL